MSNLVALGQTVWAVIGCPKNFWWRWAPPLKMLVVSDPLERRPVPYKCYTANLVVLCQMFSAYIFTEILPEV